MSNESYIFNYLYTSIITKNKTDRSVFLATPKKLLVSSSARKESGNVAGHES